MADAQPLIAIVGPTAVGKTATSIRLAQRFDGEILSADSRQLYRGMDIGTAKATAEEQAAVPHHLVDVCDPRDTLTLAEFQERVYATMADITDRGKIPFLVGGTGLYVRAVVEGYGIPRVPPDEELRKALFTVAATQGPEVLHTRLEEVDPEAAESIDARNVRRVVRALEVYEKSGTPISVLQRKNPPPYRILQLGLTRERERLYERVDRRIDKMLEAGLIDEVEDLLDAGIPADCEAMSALGYRETVAYLRGDIPSPEELTAEIGRSTRRFIRTQYNWFRLSDPKIHWFDLDEIEYEEIEEFVGEWLMEG
ncbi:MAG: tRNA (adenosine(37)-N6)-dimethylallyltransferase MiaA [Chloroflexota bacterium]|nr:tRNA (adenosine(37)-N6)-dimethylallyltransferase MiaA [Chloroflexota bacterium]